MTQRLFLFDEIPPIRKAGLLKIERPNLNNLIPYFDARNQKKEAT